MKIRIRPCSFRRHRGQNVKGPAAGDGGSYIRSSGLHVPRIILSVFVLLLGIDAAAAENLPAQTIVVFNTAVPDSEALAKFYAGKRGIADDHVIGLACPSEEEISREQYDATIAVARKFSATAQRWWHRILPAKFPPEADSRVRLDDH